MAHDNIANTYRTIRLPGMIQEQYESIAFSILFLELLVLGAPVGMNHRLSQAGRENKLTSINSLDVEK